MATKFTLAQFNKEFLDDDACLEWLKNHLYPNGIHCSVCDKVTKHHRITTRKSYACDVCGHHVHPTAGTIYHKSSTPLRYWFYAVFQVSATRTGYSAKQLEREIGVTYKTAWRMLHQIRKMLAEDHDPFDGEVEVDESWMADRDYSPERSKNERKAAVFGVVQRHGPIVLQQIIKPTTAAVREVISRHVQPGPASRLHTDEWFGYKRLDGTYNRVSVNHSRDEYVKGALNDIHTNTIEGFWSLLKGAIVGTYRGVSQKHLQRYLDEYGFRYTRRRSIDPMFTQMMSRVQKSA